MTMNLKNFVDFCEGDLDAVEKALKILCQIPSFLEDWDFETFAETNSYLDGKWDLDNPFQGSR